MTIKQAIEIAKIHNEWRRGRIETFEYFHKPKEIGIAIDTLVKFAEKQLKKK